MLLVSCEFISFRGAELVMSLVVCVADSTSVVQVMSECGLNSDIIVSILMFSGLV